MARIAWLTDLHLDFIEPATAIADSCRSVADCPSDVVLVGGDISTAASLEAHLRQLEAAVQRPIYFVLGNHDFYGGHIADVRGRASELSRSRPESKLIVLCGHTHSPGFVQVRPNLEVHTGAAEYGSPAIQPDVVLT